MALEESKSSVLDYERTPRQHSPMLKPKTFETDDSYYFVKEFPSEEEENKDSVTTECEKCKIESIDLGTRAD